MRYLYVDLPDAPEEGFKDGDRIHLAIRSTTQQSELYTTAGRIFIGPVPETPEEAEAAGQDSLLAGLSSIRGPFFKATIIESQSGRHSPAVINADHVALARPATSGPNDQTNETLILLDNGIEYRLEEPYEAIAEELYGVRDVDDVSSIA